MLTKHAEYRGLTRAEVDKDKLLEMTETAGLVADLPNHKYLRNDDFVMIFAKNNEKTEVLKTVIFWNEFRKNIQNKIERYN